MEEEKNKCLHGELEVDIEIKAPAAKFHDVFSCRPHHISNVCPDKIQGVDLHEGDWGSPGTIVNWNYVHDGNPEVAKEIIEAIDDENNITTFKVIEGHLLEKYKNFHIIVQATPKVDSEGSLVHWILKYEKLSEDIPEPKGMLQLAIDVTKDIDEHLTQSETEPQLHGQLEVDIEIKAPAAMFHDVFSCRPHHISNVCPDKIQGVDLHEGDWGSPGTIVNWNYVHDGNAEVAKEIIEAIDDENNITTFKVIEGHLLEKYKNFHIIVQATPKADSEGSLVHWILKYEKLSADIPEPKGILQLVIEVTKDIDDHLTQPET